MYEQIHKEYPQNLECLRYLVAICKELGMPYDEHENHLRKLERQVAQSAASQNGGGLAGGILTQMNGGEAQQQNNYRGGNGGNRGEVNRMAPIQDAQEESGNSSAPGVTNQLQSRAQSKQNNSDDDLFGDDDVDDLWTD